MQTRRQLLLRNLGVGAAIGAAIGVTQVLAHYPKLDLAMAIGQVTGSAIGGAVIFVLVAAIWTAIVR